MLQLDDRRVDLTRGEVLLGDEVIPLTIREQALLGYLHQHQGRVISRDELHREVWGHTVSLKTRAADFAIRRLRSKLEVDPANPVHLKAQYGEGYVLVLAEQAPEAPVNDGFVGRTAELDHLKTTFDEGTRVITLLATGGMGKTTLAREFGATRAQRPTVFADLSSASDLVTSLQIITAALDIPLREHGDDDHRIDGIAEALGPILLILDNVEHITEHATRILERCTGGLAWFLVTSRVRLPIGAVLLLGPLSTTDGEELFLHRLASLRGSLPDSPTLRSEAAELVEKLDGHPLAIELAAARGRLFTPGALLKRLSDRLALLQDSRSRSLRSTIDWSWSLLTPAQQSAFAQCAVFPGPFSAEAAYDVLDSDEDVFLVLEQLCDHSMVQTWSDPSNPGLRLFESLRVYALEQLHQLGHQSATEQRYRTWVVTRSTELLNRTLQTGSRRASAALQAIAADIYRAHALALEQEPSTAPALLAPIRYMLGPTREAQAYVEATLDVLPSNTPEAIRLEAERWGAELDSIRGAPGATERLRDFLEAAQQAGDAQQVANAHHMLSSHVWRFGDLDAAREHLEQAAKGLRRARNRAQEGLVSASLAGLSALHGELSEAESHARRAQHLAPDHVRCQLYVHSILGLVRIRQGDEHSARTHLEKALERLPDVADQRAVGLALANIGIRFGRLGERERSADLLLQSVEQYDQLGLPNEGARTRLQLCQLLLLQGDLDAAGEGLQQIRQIQERYESPPVGITEALWLMGLHEGLRGQHAVALQHFRTAIRQATSCGAERFEGLAWLGCLLLPDASDVHAEASARLEALASEQQLLQTGRTLLQGAPVEARPIGPEMTLLLLQKLRNS